MVFVKYKYKGFWVSHCGICEIAGWSVAKPWFEAPSTTCPRADIYCNWKTIVKYWKANILLIAKNVWMNFFWHKVFDVLSVTFPMIFEWYFEKSFKLKMTLKIRKASISVHCCAGSVGWAGKKIGYIRLMV